MKCFLDKFLCKEIFKFLDVCLILDESKTHLILSPFFMNILRLNV